MTKNFLKIDEKGSLGLLALGDIGLIEWRKVKQQGNNKKTKDTDEKK